MATALTSTLVRPENPEPPMTRREVLTRYRRLREISKLHHSKVLDFLPGRAILQQARRLGIAEGGTIVLDHMDELTLAFDLAIYTAPIGRTRAIERYARSASRALGPEEAAVLEAMCGARFSIVIVQQRHPLAGLLVRDTLRETDLWLVDEGLEKWLPDGAAYATRYYQPDVFAVTAGIGVPADPAFLEIALSRMPELHCASLTEAADDRRFAESIYRTALLSGVMDGVSYQDPSGEIA